jgi:hypothetical protein
MQESEMADEHHLYAVIAKVICDARKDKEHQIDAEEAVSCACRSRLSRLPDAWSPRWCADR